MLDRPVSMNLMTAFGAAMVPVLFAFGGWQTANFVAGEVREPRKNLAKALMFGVVGVIVLYLSVNFVCVRRSAPTGWRTPRARNGGHADRDGTAGSARS